MGRIPGLRRFLRLPHRTDQRIVREIDEELAFHLEMVAGELAASGMSPDEARREARRRFGDLARARKSLGNEDRVFERERRRGDLAGELRQDVLFAARQLRHAPGFTAVTVLTLALGIGVTTAIFSVVDGVLLRPLPYADPDGLVRLWQVEGRDASERDDTSPANFHDWQQRNRSFERMALFQYYGHDVRGKSGETISLNSFLVSENYFEVMGVRPQLGRTFLPEEHRSGGQRVMIISHGLWQQRYGGDPAVIGRREIADGVPHTIVGVMPPTFQYPEKREIWAPKLFTEQELRDRASTYLAAVGRLKPGVTLAAAQEDMARVARELASENGSTNSGVGVLLTSLPDDLLGRVRPALLVLLGAVGFVLLIACANIANLLLARGADRRREFAIRAALGAGRGRLTRQMVTESVMLAALGGLAGLAFARWGIDVLLALRPETLPRADGIGLDLRVLLFAVVASVSTALLFGIAPALQFSRPDLQDVVKDGGRGTTGARGRERMRGALITAEVALAVVLLVGSGLLIRSFAHLVRVDPGFVPAQRAMVQVFLWDQYAKPDLRAGFMRDALERLRAVPGVEAVGAVSALPMADANIGIEVPLVVEGRPKPTEGEAPSAYVTTATHGYFETMGVSLRRGRTFRPSDDAAAPRVALVSESLARKQFPGEDPIGKRISVRFDGGRPREVIGVVADVRHEGLDSAPRQEVYIPHAQFPFGSMTLVARTTVDPATVLQPLQRAIWEINPNQAIYAATTMRQLVSDSLRERRFHLVLLGAFAVLALALAAVGVYGLISYSTSRRAHEFGVRLALGASGSHIVGAAMRDGVRYAVVGVTIGMLAALALTRLLRGMLYGVTPNDPATFATLAALMLAVAAAASLIPARRALRVDPVSALRGEG